MFYSPVTLEDFQFWLLPFSKWFLEEKTIFCYDVLMVKKGVQYHLVKEYTICVTWIVVDHSICLGPVFWRVFIFLIFMRFWFYKKHFHICASVFSLTTYKYLVYPILKVERKNIDSCICNHLQSIGHRYTNMEILQIKPHGYTLNTLLQYEISKH